MRDDALRTPDAHFADIPDFDYPVFHADDLPGYEGYRAAWVEAGPADADRVFLCLHGEPTWSFLYRRMIPHFTASGARVVAPDFFGFGRSDKPILSETYTFDFHRDHILALVRRLDLRNITLVVQDWGGLIGLTLPVDADFRSRLSRLIVMNTALGVGTDPGEGFLSWKAYAASQPDIDVGALIARGTPHLRPEEIAAYDAPFPGPEYKMGVRTFPELVPVRKDMDGVEVSLKAASFWRTEWEGESFMAIGEADPVLGPPVMNALRELIRGCPEPMLLADAGHFVQEWGEPVAVEALKAFGDIA